MNKPIEEETAKNGLSDEAGQALYAIAYNAYQSGNYQDSTAFFRLLAFQNNDNKSAWMGLGASLQMLKKYEEAIGAYGFAAVLDPDDPYVHLHAAECFHALNDKEKALLALNSALASSPKEELKKQLELLKSLWTQGGVYVA